MSQQGMRTFSTEFKQAVVLRLEAGERIAAVAEELKIGRKLLYEWRAAYRKLGEECLNMMVMAPYPGFEGKYFSEEWEYSSRKWCSTSQA